MTVICALHQDGETWIGSDQRACANDAIIPGGRPKWSVHAGWALGHAGDARLGDVVEHEKIALFEGLEDAFALTERMRKIFPKHGVDFKPRDGNSGTAVFPGSFLLANAKQVWSLGPCLALTPIDSGSLYARGSGGPEANGAGYALEGSVAPFRLLFVAISAAVALDLACGGEPWILKLEG